MIFARNWGLLTVAMLTISLSLCGCGGSSDTPDTSPASQEEAQDQAENQTEASLEGPALTVHSFLTAAKAGNDEEAMAMLTQVAREKAAGTTGSLTPNRSDTASFEIGDIEYLAEDGARVECTLSDMGNTTRMVWMVRKDPEGWRIAGTALEVFKDETPVLFNFEDPEEMERKLGWIKEEMMRRSGQGSKREVAETPTKPTVR